MPTRHLLNATPAPLSCTWRSDATPEARLDLLLDIIEEEITLANDVVAKTLATDGGTVACRLARTFANNLSRMQSTLRENESVLRQLQRLNLKLE